MPMPPSRWLVRRPCPVGTRVEILDKGRAGGHPAEKLASHGARRREIHAEEGTDPSEMTLDVIRRNRHDGKVEGTADGLRDVAGRYSFFRDSVQAGTSRSLREPESDHTRGIGPVHCRPPVGPVSRVTGDALLACYRGDYRDEPIVAGSVYGRREAQAYGVHPAADELARKILAAATR